MPDYFGGRYFGPVVGTTAPAGSTTSRRSLSACRRLLGDRLGGLTLCTTSSTAPDTSSIVSLDLAGGVDPNAYAQAWLYVEDGTQAGVLRRVPQSSLNTTTGTLKVSVPFATPVAAGVTVGLYTLLPPVRRDRFLGLRECLNLALAEMWMPARLPLLGVANQPRYDLSSYDWIDPDAVREVWDPALASSLHPAPHPTWTAYQDADAVRLAVEPLFTAGEAVEVETFRPLDTWIKTAGVWGESSLGYVNDTDESLAQPQSLVLVALVYAYEALAASDPDRATLWDQKAQRQRLRANVLKFSQLSHTPKRLGARLRSAVGYEPKDFASW